MNNVGKLSPLAVAIAMALSQPVIAETTEAETSGSTNNTSIEEVTVIGKSVSYANNISTPEMVNQQSAMSSVMAMMDNLSGVRVNEGDTLVTDDWSTTVSIRGFQLSLDEQ
jgi:iron complex outermembrane recepter protein